MDTSFGSVDSWKSLKFGFQIAAWGSGLLTILFGIGIYWANSNLELAKKSPRLLKVGSGVRAASETLPTKPETPPPGAPAGARPPATTPAIETPPLSPPPRAFSCVLIVAAGGTESDGYANQIADLLGQNYPIKRFSINTMFSSEPTSEISYIGNGFDPSPLISLLEKNKIKVEKNPVSILPVPASVWKNYSDCIALLVGPKPG